MNRNSAHMSAAARRLTRTRIGQRLVLSMMAIVTALVIPTIVVIGQTVSYQRQYDKVLENLGDISYIIQETETQGYRIIDYFTMDVDIWDSGEADIIVQMLYRVGRIRENMGDDSRYQENLDTLQIVENLLNSYTGEFKEGVAKCGDKFSMAGDSEFYSMVDTAKYIVKNCNRLQALEMNRSSDLQADISGSFRTTITVLIIVIIVIIVLVIFLVYILTESITHPLGILMSHIKNVADAGLMDAAGDKEVGR